MRTLTEGIEGLTNDLHCQLLLEESQGQVLLIFTARPGTVDDEKLQLLSVIGSQHLAPRS